MKTSLTNTNPTHNVPDSVVVNNTPKETTAGFYFCISAMLQLSLATTEFSKGLMYVLQENTRLQERKTKQLANTPLIQCPQINAEDKPAEAIAYKAFNQQLTAERQLIQQELSSSQQRAQTNQQSVNSCSTMNMQIIQACSAILEQLSSASIKANLTRPVE